MSSDAPFDLLIIGGGVNGCGIARDAAGRGARVALIEQGDLAGATSSASTKLIHGGLRYLEHYEFKLVREALEERERLWAIAPHLIQPLRFVLPHHRSLRPRWMLRLGLFLYDHIGGRKRLPATKSLDFRTDPAGAVLDPQFKRGFEYSDCQVDDARLVALNALDAAEHGARILTRTRVTSAQRADGLWKVRAAGADGRTLDLTAHALVNAAGPWADAVAGLATPHAGHRLRLVRGSHIVVRGRLDDRAFIFQNGDGRIVFAIPYQDEFTLIGTTDADHTGGPDAVTATEAEVDYLIEAIGEYLAKPITREDIVWRYAGVRALLDDGASSAQEATRDYVLSLDVAEGVAPALHVFGGKITTYRHLAEAAIDKLSHHASWARAARWTAHRPLPGGDLGEGGLAGCIEGLIQTYPFLSPMLARRLARAYGSRARVILGDAKALEDLGQDFGAGLYEREVRYLMDVEWARTADDVVWRRSKLGLWLDADQRAALDAFMASREG
jgi:glycerol-3-phosphate dehydrogenase